MFNPTLIREEISAHLNPIRATLADDVLLRIHPDKVKNLAIADNQGDILILFPEERVISSLELFGDIAEQTRSLQCLILVNLPNYYSSTGASEVAQRIEASLGQLKPTDAILPIRFDRRREFARENRWILELYFEIVGIFKTEPLVAIADTISLVDIYLL